tara:strand:+ start:701 stop:1324 length:624 start_codon:yes stop_codon:yes gene_type:complete
MGLKTLPFRQYSDHDVVNLFRVADGMVLDSTTGAGSGDAGTFVKVSAGDFSLDPVSYGADDYLGKTDYANVGRAQYPKVNLQVEPVQSSAELPLGITLLQTAKADENGEKLLYNPQKAGELQAALPGQAVPIATKGIFTIGSSAFQGDLGGDLAIGSGLASAAGGTVTGCDPNHDNCFATIIGTGSRSSQNGQTDQFAGEYLVFKFN